MKRQPVKLPTVYLRGPQQVAYLLKLIPNLPLDPDRPVEVVIREAARKRKVTLNDAYWAGPLRDIAEQAWTNGRLYSADEWHEGFKVLFLPDPDASDFDPSHVVDPEAYQKWAINPVTGERRCVGSTTRLTDAGMRVYLLQVEAFAAEKFGVVFTTHQEPVGRIA